MFELYVALKYLIPRKKSLSTALISLLSALVIALVVWLALVFLSVTSGIEKNWLTKLTALHAPLRISPTEHYYRSYYYRIDSLSADAGYSLKSLGEKAKSQISYNPQTDREIPPHFPKPEALDPVKEAIQEIEQLNLPFQEYEIGSALLRIQRNGQLLSQMSFLLTEPINSPHFTSLLIKAIEPKPDAIGILLPKNFMQAGIQLGDLATLNYSAASAFSVQEHKLKVYVRGFYDPGLMSLGNKCIIAPPDVVRTIQAASQTFSPDGTPTNGFFVYCRDFSNAETLKQQLEERFFSKDIAPYWKIDTYKDFEFCKEIFQQFQSDKALFLLVSSLILFVACTNIISLLALLVNDKKKEIAILISMGANLKQIAAIFGFCGAFLGTLGAAFGTLLAWATMKHIDSVVAFLSMIQGRKALNPAFFGEALPSALSIDAILFILIATPLLSLLAGLIPAIKATRIHPAKALRSE